MLEVLDTICSSTPLQLAIGMAVLGLLVALAWLACFSLRLHRDREIANEQLAEEQGHHRASCVLLLMRHSSEWSYDALVRFAQDRRVGGGGGTTVDREVEHALSLLRHRRFVTLNEQGNYELTPAGRDDSLPIYSTPPGRNLLQHLLLVLGRRRNRSQLR